jgi:hypothetical protein
VAVVHDPEPVGISSWSREAASGVGPAVIVAVDVVVGLILGDDEVSTV